MIKNEANSSNDSFFTFIKCISKSSPEIYENISGNKKKLSCYLKYTDQIILNYLNKCESKKSSKKAKARNILYINKILRNEKMTIKYKLYSNDSQQIIFQNTISFIFNIFKHLLLCKKNGSQNESKTIVLLDDLLNNIINIIGKLYQDAIINDDYLEIILKLLIFCTTSSSIDKEPSEKDEIRNVMFLESCINTIKIVFNNCIKLDNKLSQRQEQLINNIILFINNNISSDSDEQNRISYINKVFLSKYDYKKLLLIDLYHIIAKIESKDIKKNFIDLLTNIYNFSFKYENIMCPMVRQLGSLMINLKNKNVKQIKDELDMSDFSLSLLNSLIQKEEQILKKNTCLLQRGFYFGSELSGLICDFNSFGDDLIILFGFKLESLDLDEITLFQIINNKDKSSQMRLYLTNKGNDYALSVSNKNDEISTKIFIDYKQYYVLAIHFKIGTLTFMKYTLNFNFSKDAKNEIYSGNPVKIEIKNENVSMYIGCEFDRISNTINNKFRGFIGDIIFLNAKHIDKKKNEFMKTLVELKRDYCNICNLFAENYIIYNKYQNANPNYIELKNRIKAFAENDKLYDSIKAIISPNSFKLIEYNDNIDLNSNDIENKQINIKKKFIDFRIKSSHSEEEKKITINTSFYNKYFHIFYNDSTLIEFIKCDGINFLSMITEYSYQILIHLYTNYNYYKENEVKEICKIINQKIFNNLSFFYDNIIKTITNVQIEMVNKYFYQITITLLQLMKIDLINTEIIEIILNIFNAFDSLKETNDYEMIKYIIFDFLINPELYQEKDELLMKKLNYIMKNIFNIIKKHSNNKTIFMSKIYNNDILDKLLFFDWLIDRKIKNENDEIIIIKRDKLFESTSYYYFNVLIEFLKSCDSIKEIDLKVIQKKHSSRHLSVTEKKKDHEMFLLFYFFDKVLEYRDKKSYIFARMLYILFKTNLVDKFDKDRIDKLEQIVKSKLEIKEDEKNLIIVSCLILLIRYYYTNEKNKGQYFHSFIVDNKLNLDFFKALISSLKQIKFLSNEINEEKENNKIDQIDELKDSNNKIINEKGMNENEEDNINEYLKDEVDLCNKCLLPLSDIDLKQLNWIQKHIIINIFEDIIEKLEIDNENPETLKIIEILENNFDCIFKYPGTQIYEDLFSSETKICAELFYLKLNSNNNNNAEDKKNEIKDNSIIRYHLELLKNHGNPFIFKYFILLSNNYIQENNNNEILIKRMNDIKLPLLDCIVNTLRDYLKSIKNEPAPKEENNKNELINIYNNLLNLLIVLNEEFDYYENSFLFKSKEFYEIFYKYISLLDETSLLYSNYCIESCKDMGKIISEVIYDIFFSISEYSFNEAMFTKTFTKINIKEQEVFTIFYLIDILKGKKLKDEPKTNDELKKYIPNVDNLKLIHRKYFKKKNKTKLKLFLNKKIYPIEDVNLSIYFLGKSFIYLKKKETINDKFKQLLKAKFLKLLYKNIFRLYTKRSNFYGYNNCQYFPLYYQTKKYFESYIIQNPDNFEGFEDFFDNDMKINLKEEYNIAFCYSSRLLPDFKKIIESNDSSKNESIHNKSDELNNDNKTKESDHKIFSISFEIIKKNNIIFTPKNYYFKNIFAEMFKDLFFNDKTFKSLKLAYFTKYKKYEGLEKESKQTNFPIKQKNYSNSVEPKIFLKRDFNFYNKNFLKVSHKYLNFDALNLNEKKDNFYLYPHKIKVKENTKSLFCELVTIEYVIFGKMYFSDYYIYFESEEDPRGENEEHILKDLMISTRFKDNMIRKQKTILIFNIDIKEIIQRRTLLVNQSIEIFHKNGKSYFFNFFRTKNVEEAYKYLREINKIPQSIFDTINNNNNLNDIKNLTQSYQKGKFSNYDYILYLNKYSTRTYNDSSQYPVFPWLVKDYKKIQKILNSLENKESIQEEDFRDMKYPISSQNDDKRKEYMEYFIADENNEFPHHLFTHYSTSAYLYYYLARINPFGKNLIKLQNDSLEDSTRMFLSFKETEGILFNNTNKDNRELIPDFFCYIDFYCNLNCFFFGIEKENSIIDDINFEKYEQTKEFKNNISIYVNALLKHKKLFNNSVISKILPQWVDIIFGKKQLPKKKEECLESCNIYEKYAYEQLLDLQKYIDEIFNLFEEKKITEKKLIDKIKTIKDPKLHFGVNPRQILNDVFVNKNDGKSTTLEANKEKKTNDDKYIYFNILKKGNYILIKKKNKKRLAVVYNKNFKGKESTVYDCRCMVLMKNKKNKEKIPLYKYNYAFTFIIAKCEKHVTNVFLSCQYLENFFRIQYEDKILNIFYDDFITCIKGRNSAKEGDHIFYTGLLNGKLTEWELIPTIEENKKSKIKYVFNFEVKELKSIYAHKSPITAIEIYLKQNIIVTSGEDKFIYIRKIFDFELLTVINLIYSFGNPIISRTCNIFPSLLKISDLNLLYVLLYDKDNNTTFIRGYNLNGLFFAQTDPKLFKDKKELLQFNNISFTKNSNLIVGFYNSKSFYVINASDLTPLWIKNIENNEMGTEMIEYNCNEGEFYILYKNKFIVMTLTEKEFESF